MRQDIERDEPSERLRDIALARGYRSTAAFPIHLGGRAIGVIKLYSTQVAAFDDEEVRLLTELADHLSFALEAMESERLRQEAEARYRSIFEKGPQPCGCSISLPGGSWPRMMPPWQPTASAARN